MTQQWLRQCKLTVDGGGSAIDMSELRIRFNVTQQSLQTPAAADIVITNISRETANRVKKEGLGVTLEAGYQGNSSTLFKGEVIQARFGRETPVDTYLNIIAQVGDQAYNFGMVNKTLAAGHTYRDQVDAVFEGLKKHGITLGKIADLGTKQMPRARVMYGMARDILRVICMSTNTSWSIHNNELTITKDDEPNEGGAIVLNSRTGLIGFPTQTIDGIQARCLLNPKIRPGTLVQIDQASVQEVKLSPAYPDQVKNAMAPGIADDGFYKVLVAEHEGDTRDIPWYTNIICTRADGGGMQPIGIANKGINVEPQ